MDETLLVDVAAVGSSKNGDIRSKCGIPAWDETSKQWSAEIRKVSYPVAEIDA